MSNEQLQVVRDESDYLVEPVKNPDMRVLETAEDIQARREQVLQKYRNIKEASNIRRERLLESKAFQYFKNDADEFETWLHEKLRAVNDQSDATTAPTNVQARIQRHEAFEQEVLTRQSALEQIGDHATELISTGHYESKRINEIVVELYRLWDELLKSLKLKSFKLNRLTALVEFIRACDEFLFWIGDKEASFVRRVDETESLERIESLKKQYEEAQRDLVNNETRLLHVNELANELIETSQGVLDIGEVRGKQKEVIDAWNRVRSLAFQRQEELFGVHEIQRLVQDIQETIDWIDEKNDSITSQNDDYGHDLSSVQALQRKHDSLERNIIIVGEKVESHNREANRLTNVTASTATQLAAKLNEMNNKWRALIEKCEQRKQALSVSYKLHSFTGDYRDLANWYDEMSTVLNAENFGTDISTVEVLIECNLEYKRELESRDESFYRTVQNGRDLVNQLNDVPDKRNQVQDKINHLEAERRRLDEIWSKRNRFLNECLRYQIYSRDAEQFEISLNKLDAALSNTQLGASVDDVEALIKKHTDLDKSLAAHDEKAQLLDDAAGELIRDGNHASDQVAEKRDRLRRLLAQIGQKSTQRAANLNLALQYYVFERDCDELLGWIGQKSIMAQSREYLDASNLDAKLQKHANLDVEVKTLESRVDSVCNEGKRLIDFDQGRIDDQLLRLTTAWRNLIELIQVKYHRLRQAIDGKKFHLKLADLDLWLSDLELEVQSPDHGKDLNTVLKLTRKLNDLKEDLVARSDRIDEMKRYADEFERDGHFDADNIRLNVTHLVSKYESLHDPIEERLARLYNWQKYFELRQEIEDELEWIRDKDLIVSARKMFKTGSSSSTSSVNLDYMDVRNLVTKHQSFMTELTSHEPRIYAVVNLANDMVQRGQTLPNVDVPGQVDNLEFCWTELKRHAAQLKHDLDDELLLLNYFADALEAHAWLREKEQLVSMANNNETGTDEDSAESLLKRHQALMVDIQAFGRSTVYGDLRSLAVKCKPVQPKQKPEMTRNASVYLAGDDVDSVIVLYDYTEESDRNVGVKKGQVLRLIDSSNDEWWRVVLEDGRKVYVPKTYVRLLAPAEAAEARVNDIEMSSVNKKQRQIEQDYERLLVEAREREAKLAEACELHRLNREAAEINQWLTIKQELTNEMIEEKTPEELDTNLDQLKQELKVKDAEIRDLCKLAEKLNKQGKNQTEEAKLVYAEIERQKANFENFKKNIEEVENKLLKAYELKKYGMDSEETLKWIKEKKRALEEERDNYGDDFPTVKRLLRKHEAVERDLEALGTIVQDLDDRAQDLIYKTPEQAKEVYSSQVNVQNAWKDLSDEAERRKYNLVDSFDYQNFVTNYRDLKLWFETKIAQVSSEELAKDEPSADALIERNQEHKTEIDTQKAKYIDFNNFGVDLIKTNHPKSDDVDQKLNEINKLHERLLKAWQVREIKLNQCLSLILFNRDCEQAEKWMKTREASLASDSAGVENSKVEEAFRKHEDLDRAIQIHSEKIGRLQQTADDLVEFEHYDVVYIQRRLAEVIERWNKLKQALIEHRYLLDDSQMLEQFKYDANVIEEWVDEKLDATTELANQPLKDSADILRKQQKQELIDSEISANKDRINSLENLAEKIKGHEKFPESDREVKDRLDVIINKWKQLKMISSENLLKLKDNIRKKQVEISIKDMEFWLKIVEIQLSVDDHGSDLTSAENLLKKYKLIETDILAHQEPIKELNNASATFADTQPAIRSVNDRYEAIKNLLETRKQRILHAYNLFQLMHDIDEEDAWIKEKKLVASSDDYGRDLPSIQNLRRRHKRLLNEISSHEPKIDTFRKNIADVENEQRDKLAAFTNEIDAVRNRWAILLVNWQELNDTCTNRGSRLDQSLAYHNWSTLVNEELAWLNENEHFIANKECGDTLTVTQSLSKKHEAFETDLKVHQERLENLTKKGETLCTEGNHFEPKIRQLLESSKRLIEEVLIKSREKRLLLKEYWTMLMFYWRIEVVEKWIVQKDIQLSSNTLGESLKAVRDLLVKHETFSKSLKAFEKESLTLVRDLKDELIQAKSLEREKTKINQRYEQVWGRWQMLLNKTQMRQEQLNELEAYFKSIDESLLRFAKKAYEINSWFENSEEDLTDPVKCLNLEQINEQLNSFNEFLKSIEKIAEDLLELKDIDVQIKKVYKLFNPYTWHTIEQIYDSWTSLQRLINDREQELNAEKRRQEENEKYCKEYARLANQFYKWLNDTRVEMLDIGSSSLNLNEQLDVTNRRLESIRDAYTQFQEIERLGSILDDRLVLENKYTEHTTLSLSQALDQLEQLGLRMIHNLQQQIQALSQTGVTEKLLREFTLVFKHFDKTNQGKLNHQEFKSCLQALGYDFPPNNEQEKRFEEILDLVDPNRSGYVGMQEYMMFLINRETENISSADDVLNSFRALTTDGNKPFITSKELYANLTPEQAQYCLQKMKPYVTKDGVGIRDAYDYEQFVKTLFNK